MQKTKTMTQEDIQEEIAFIEAEKNSIRDSMILYGNPEDNFGEM